MFNQKANRIMKTKKILLTATMMLFGVGAFAQSNDPLKGDVNGDGVVDMADVSFILNIIREKAKQTQPETEYYIYCAKTPPTAEMNPKDYAQPLPESGRLSIGWYSLGTTLPSTIHGKSFHDDNGSDDDEWYVALPTEGYYRGTATDFRGASYPDQIGTIFYDGVSYTIFGDSGSRTRYSVWMATLKVTDITGR